MFRTCLSPPNVLTLALLGALVSCGPGGSSGGDAASRSDASDGSGDSGSGADAAGGSSDARTVDSGTPPGPDARCPTLAAVGPTPLPVESAASNFESTGTNGFTDDYVYNQAGTIKLGTRQEWGGTIVFFGMSNGSPGMNGTNVIDANDTGREVQVAFYDPDRQMQNCAWNASCVSTPTTCPFSITYLGWNPVQGGNRCNKGSGIDSITRTDGALTVTTTPLFWNPNWDRNDCVSDACGDATLSRRRSDVQVIQRTRFVAPRIVELDYVLTNLGTLEHRATAHELPTVYTGNGNGGPNLLRLFNSAGTEVAIDTPGNDGFFFKNFSSPGGWVTMQNSALDYGVGIYHENRLTEYQGWQKLSLPFNNFRAIFSFAIPSLGQVRARSYLLIGSQATIAADAQWLDTKLPAFGVMDAPADEASVSGVITVRGWALDNKGVSAIELTVDGGVPMALSYGSSRPDVAAVWPGYAGGASVGYSGSLDTSGLGAAECGHVLEVTATDTDGNQRVIARRRIYAP